jgi:hypothetical protein
MIPQTTKHMATGCRTAAKTLGAKNIPQHKKCYRAAQLLAGVTNET